MDWNHNYSHPFTHFKSSIRIFLKSSYVMAIVYCVTESGHCVSNNDKVDTTGLY